MTEAIDLAAERHTSEKLELHVELDHVTSETWQIAKLTLAYGGLLAGRDYHVLRGHSTSLIFADRADAEWFRLEWPMMHQAADLHEGRPEFEVAE